MSPSTMSPRTRRNSTSQALKASQLSLSSRIPLPSGTNSSPSHSPDMSCKTVKTVIHQPVPLPPLTIPDTMPQTTLPARIKRRRKTKSDALWSELLVFEVNNRRKHHAPLIPSQLNPMRTSNMEYWEEVSGVLRDAKLLPEVFSRLAGDARLRSSCDSGRCAANWSMPGRQCRSCIAEAHCLWKTTLLSALKKKVDALELTSACVTITMIEEAEVYYVADPFHDSNSIYQSVKTDAAAPAPFTSDLLIPPGFEFMDLNLNRPYLPVSGSKLGFTDINREIAVC